MNSNSSILSMAMRRAAVIVTGSREWSDGALIAAELLRCEQDAKESGQSQMLLVHGGCERGADSIAHNWAKGRPNWSIRMMEPDWAQFGRFAGLKRNEEMVNEYGPKAFAMLAFSVNNSPGTANSIKHFKTHDPSLKKTRIFHKKVM